MIRKEKLTLKAIRGVSLENMFKEAVQEDGFYALYSEESKQWPPVLLIAAVGPTADVLHEALAELEIPNDQVEKQAKEAEKTK